MTAVPVDDERPARRPPAARLSSSQLFHKIPTEGICATSGKHRYRTRKLAAQALAVVRTTPIWQSPDGTGHVYRHPACGSWHLTHLPPPAKETR